MKTKKKVVKKIEVIGYRWFQKSYGNTYHVVKVYINDEPAYISPMTYGYGDQYAQTAFDWLAESGTIPTPDGIVTPRIYIQDKLGIEYIYHSYDVKRERDLKALSL